MSLQDWLLEHTTLLRSGLFLCCIGWWWILLLWLRPSESLLRRSALAVLVHFGLGVALDVLVQRAGGWRYRDLGFTVDGVPLDLHLNWTLIWGFGVLWLFERWPRMNCSGVRAAGYIALWTLLTCAFDVAIHQWMLFLESWSALWWLWDCAFLATVFFMTLWVHASVGKRAGERCGIGSLPAIPPYWRSLLYLGCIVPLFFVLVPLWLESLAAHFGYPVDPGPIPLLPAFLALAALGLGGWAVREFALTGDGTPIPWDPPRRLVISGPYAFVANPMQLSGLLLCLAVLLQRPSWVSACYLFTMAIFTCGFFTLLEPEALRDRLGESWQRYRSRARLFLPHMQPHALAGGENPILFVDGDCGLCQRSVAWALACDVTQVLRVAPLGGETHKRLIKGRMLAIDSILLYEQLPDGSALISTRTRAVLRLIGLGPLPIAILSALEGVPGLVPVADVGYRAVARVRRHLFQKTTLCEIGIEKDPRLSTEWRSLPHASGK